MKNEHDPLSTPEEWAFPPEEFPAPAAEAVPPPEEFPPPRAEEEASGKKRRRKLLYFLAAGALLLLLAGRLRTALPLQPAAPAENRQAFQFVEKPMVFQRVGNCENSRLATRIF